MSFSSFLYGVLDTGCGTGRENSIRDRNDRDSGCEIVVKRERE